MKIGAMNHPMRDVLSEIEFFAQNGFDFIDLTLEPALARSDLLPVEKIRAALKGCGLGVVGHTAYYLPLASPFPELRRVATDELKRCVEVFAHLGASRMNVHPFCHAALHKRAFLLEHNIEALAQAVAWGKPRGVDIMVENLPTGFNRADELAPLFEAVPDLGFHLDVAHANLRIAHNATEELLARFSNRLAHVHLSDNRGGAEDLHLPLGAGAIDWAWVIRILKRHRYDGTFTLEVFAPDRDYLLLSRRKFMRWWSGEETPPEV
ncbi:MAG: sugar phosphate isomerase/epimerase [Armatimonadetes bacterium]|nr:sugar phosphate isomerase/epimerase [Armatimonadota bacterium]